MTDPAPDSDPNSGDGADIRAEAGPAPGIPRWVKFLAIGGLVAVVLIVIVMLVAGGQHGPGRHAPAAAETAGGQASPDTVTDGPSLGSSGGSAVGGPASEDEASRTVDVTTLDTMAFRPSSIEVSAARDGHVRRDQ